MVIGTALVDGLRLAANMAWETWWALVFGFTLTGIIEAFVSEEYVSQLLGDDDWREIGLGTLFGASSSSCSFTAVATAKTLFKKGGSAAATLAAFQFASTNLVIELALVVWVLLGWQFVLADFVGGLIAVSVMAIVYKYVLPDSWFETAREHLHEAEETVDPICGMTVDPTDEEAITLETDTETKYFCSGSCKNEYQNQQDTETDAAWYRELLSVDGWEQVSRNAIRQWDMLWEEIAIGFLIAGFLGALIPDTWWAALFSVGTEGTLAWVVASSIIAVVIAIMSFVCSVGNVPFALVLWRNGTPFGSIMSFIYGDLLIPTLVNTYRRYYGPRMAAVLFGSMFLAAVSAGVVVHYLFGFLGVIPPQGEAGGTPPNGYTIVLNILFIPLFFVEVYLAFGPDGIAEILLSFPDRARGVRQRTYEWYQRMKHTLSKGLGVTRIIIHRTGIAVRLSGQAVRMVGESLWLTGTAGVVIMKTPIRVVRTVMRVISDARKEVNRKLTRARLLRWSARQKLYIAYRLVTDPLTDVSQTARETVRRFR